MKPSVHKDVSRVKLLRILPASFASQVPKTIREPITLLLFPRGDVNGRAAQKALRKISLTPDATLFVAVYNLTEEARDAFLSAGAQILRAATDFIWSTDASLIRPYDPRIPPAEPELSLTSPDPDPRSALVPSSHSRPQLRIALRMGRSASPFSVR